MKKIAVLLALMLVTMASHAQKVDTNVRDENGKRTIGVPMRAFYIDHVIHGCFFEYNEINGTEIYNLTFAISDQHYRWHLVKWQPILMKNSNGEVIQYDFMGITDCRIVKGKYHVLVSMPLTKEQAKIIDDGLVKVRLPRADVDTGKISNLDLDFDSDLTNYLQKAKRNIDKTIPIPVTVDKSEF